jgi:gliding motility-associated-like protein
MKKLYSSFAAIAAFFYFTNTAVAQSDSCCPNAGFESQNFTNWVGYMGTITNLTLGLNQSTNTAPNDPAQHTILTVQGLDPNCLDPNTNCAVSTCMTYLAPGGGLASVRLGNDNVNYGSERLEYTMIVDSCNSGFIYSYAVVLEDPGHAPADQPKFDIQLLDQNGNLIPGPCGSYSVYAGSDSSFVQSCNFGPIYKCWISVGYDLSPYMGTQVTITFQTRDCGLGGHYGYAYIDGSCNALTATAAFCPGGNGTIVLIAPSGYASYQWNDPQGNPIPGPNGTNDTAIYSLPANIGDIFTVGMTSVSGCTTTLIVTLQPTIISSAPTVTNAICYGDTGSIVSLTGPNTGIPSWTFNWTTIGGQPVQNTVIGLGDNDTLNMQAGTYILTLTDSLGCVYSDTLTITQPPQPADTLNQISFYCDGDSTAVFYFPTGSHPSVGPGYQWESYPQGVDLPNTYPYSGVNSNTLTVGNFPVDGLQLYFTWYMNGCQHKSVITLSHTPQNPYLKPDSSANVFTPNGDLYNETFFPFRTTVAYDQADIAYYAKEYSFKVFNRWGNLIFETDDVTKTWDGRKDGNLMGTGTYFWIVTYKNRCAPDTDPPVETKGFVQLLK